jgi:CXXX repeat modification system protein
MEIVMSSPSSLSKPRDVVGKVTSEEMQAIRRLFERRNGLVELCRCLVQGEDCLYEKVVQDLGATTTAIQKWWDEKGRKYGWRGRPDGQWEISFDTAEVYLVDQT